MNKHRNESIRLPYIFNKLFLLLLLFAVLLVIPACQAESTVPPGNGDQSSLQPETVTENGAVAILPQPTSTVLVANQTKEPNLANTQLPSPTGFQGERAYQDVIYQVNLGPRTPGSVGHQQVEEYIKRELEAAGWQVMFQDTTYMNHPLRNIIATRTVESADNKPWIVLGAHYDTRFLADQDPDLEKRNEPVPGGNDGASGVAVLLELARTLPPELGAEISLVFFDAEDNGSIPNWDWLYGSRAYAESLTELPDAVVVVDMIGDADLNIYYEKNSDPAISEEIFAQAASLGYQEQFIPEPRFRMLDDHIPFLERGIRAVDLIDFDYPYWHTTDDTAEHVSADSLEAVGATLEAWLQGDLESLQLPDLTPTD